MLNEIKLQKNDDILCSAGRGRRPKVACLACALAHNNACGYDYALLNALFSDKERTGIHVTDLTGCLRRAYYEKMDGALEYPHEMLVRFVGTAVHNYIERFPSEHLDSELPLSLNGLVGTADIVYKNGTIVDTKTTRWMKPNNLPWLARQAGQRVRGDAACAGTRGQTGIHPVRGYVRPIEMHNLQGSHQAGRGRRDGLHALHESSPERPHRRSPGRDRTRTG